MSKPMSTLLQIALGHDLLKTQGMIIAMAQVVDMLQEQMQIKLVENIQLTIAREKEQTRADTAEARADTAEVNLTKANVRIAELEQAVADLKARIDDLERLLRDEDDHA